ncbi:MAG: exosome complex component RRP45 [Dehalococcoidales bacterium]|nr:exosome complex component RRP45 [Dehalococcoidales bacterium]
MSASKLETPLSLNESSFIRSALSLGAGGLRVDGRGRSDVRGVSISFPGNVSGSGCVEVKLGGTRVLAVTTADLVAPFADRPTEGALNLFISFSPLASPVFLAGQQNEPSVEIARIIDRGLRESRAIDTESLCVLAGQKVWNIRCDLHVLDHEGNMLDALNLAAVTALLHFRRPDVTVVGEQVTVHSVEDRQPVALALHHIPISSTFAFFDPSADATGTSSSTASSVQPLFVIDPSLKEEQVSDASLTVTLNVHGEVCCLQKGGGVGVDVTTLLQCTQIALTKTQELTTLIQNKLKEDAARYNTGNAVRGAQPVFHAPAKPIDAFGVNVTKPAGQHQTAGRPIEIDMAKTPAMNKSNAGTNATSRAESEDDEDDDEDEDGSDDAEDDDDESMEDQAEMAQVAKKLQARH